MKQYTKPIIEIFDYSTCYPIASSMFIDEYGETIDMSTDTILSGGEGD